MLSSPVYTIDPSNLSSEYEAILLLLLRTDEGYFVKNKIYQLYSTIDDSEVSLNINSVTLNTESDSDFSDDDSEVESERIDTVKPVFYARYSVKLTHSLLRISDKNHAILGACLGSGTSGRVFEITHNFHLMNDSSSIISNQNEVVKVQLKINQKSVFDSIAEYEFSSKTPHLGMQPPLFYKNNIFLIMRKFNGCTLLKLINEERSLQLNIENLTRLMLNIVFLKKIRSQVTNIGIVNRDIKPDNTIIDIPEEFFYISKDVAFSDSLVLANEKFCDSKKTMQIPLALLLQYQNNLEALIDLNILDYGVSKFNDYNDERETQGSPGYIAPEIYHGKGTTAKSDVFSAGCVASLLYGSTLENSDPIQSARNSIDPQFPDLFSLIPNQDPSTQSAIHNLILKMTCSDVGSRLTVDEAIQVFEDIFRKELARALANDTLQRINQIDLPCNTDKLEKMLTIIKQSLAQIHNSSECLNIFIETLNIECLMFLSNQIEVEDTLINHLNDFYSTLRKLIYLNKLVKSHLSSSIHISMNQALKKLQIEIMESFQYAQRNQVDFNTLPQLITNINEKVIELSLRLEHLSPKNVKIKYIPASRIAFFERENLNVNEANRVSIPYTIRVSK